jgi:MFS family permease
MTISHTSTSPVARFAGGSVRAWTGFAILMAIGLYMYADRQILTLQTEEIRKALSLSDFQIGMVQGFSVAVFAAVVGYPIAWLADRYDKRYVLAISIIVWSASVAACGLARTFTELFIASAMVGAGEAGLLPITYAAIPALFSGRARVLANSLVVILGRIGSGLVIAGCGLLVGTLANSHSAMPLELQHFGTWQLALLALALPGPLFALMALFLRFQKAKPEASTLRSASAASIAASPMPFLKSHAGTFATFYLGVGMIVFSMSALGAFLPVVAMRQMGATPAQVGAGLGTATLISTILSMLVVVGGNSWLVRRFGAVVAIRLLTIASIAGAITTPLFILAQTPGHIFGLIGLSFLFLSTGVMFFPQALQDLTPEPSRARLISIIIMINIVMSALAAPVAGLLSDHLKHLSNGLLIASVSTATIGLSISALCLLRCAVSYERTVEAARAAEVTL